MGAHSHRHVHGLPRHGEHHHGHLPHGRAPSGLAHHHPIRRIRSAPPSSATPRVKTVWRAVYRWFPHAVSLGVYNRRKIAGSSSWSQHAWGDAWDVASPASVKTGQPDKYLNAIVKFIGDKFSGSFLTRIIFGDSSHRNHAHVDVDPERTGTPP